MADEKVTIIDVARESGVSKGTVDRVLHNRGEVSAKTKARVMEAIERLNFEPNLHASLLASRSPHIVACLLPEAAQGTYWEKIYLGALAGGEQVAPLGVRVQMFSYDQYSSTSFRDACAQVLESAPAGVVLPPLFKADALDFVASLSSRGIPYVYVDSKPEDPGYLSYYGMPMYKSGTLSAALLTERCAAADVDRVAMVRITRDKSRQSDPTFSRREGFLDYIGANYPHCVVESVFINPSDPSSIDSTLEEFFSSRPPFRFVVMFNSRVHLIAGYLASHPVEGRRVIGFDALDGNLKMLRDGVATILIAQHAELQSKNAVVTLADFLLRRKLPLRHDNYMHMDILTRFNQEDY